MHGITRGGLQCWQSKGISTEQVKEAAGNIQMRDISESKAAIPLSRFCSNSQPANIGGPARGNVVPLVGDDDEHNDCP